MSRLTAASERHELRFRDNVRRAFSEFLALPTLVIFAFLGLAIGTYLLDASAAERAEPVRAFLEQRLFRSAGATGDLLGTIAGGVITVTSITISLLIVAIQQSASTMTTHVFDQFLRRSYNQLYFGFFVGLTLYALVTLATVNEPFNPVYGGAVAVFLTVVGLYLLILLLYTTIDQMRPAVIVEAIHDHTLAARERQMKLVRCARRDPQLTGMVLERVHSERHGFVTHIAFDAIGRAAIDAAGSPDRIEIVLHTPIGSYVSFGDAIAEIQGAGDIPTKELSRKIQAAVRLEGQRDFAFDAAFGIEQLEMVAWTSISTSKSNPAPGVLAVRALRDILARWSTEEAQVEAERAVAMLPVVYDDNPFARLFDTLESLGVAASESLQHQTLAEIARALSATYGRLPSEWRARADDVILRLLPSLGEHVLTAELDAALTGLVRETRAAGSEESARALSSAQGDLRRTIGRLGSRATRAVPTPARQ